MRSSASKAQASMRAPRCSIDLGFNPHSTIGSSKRHRFKSFPIGLRFRPSLNNQVSWTPPASVTAASLTAQWIKQHAPLAHSPASSFGTAGRNTACIVCCASCDCTYTGASIFPIRSVRPLGTLPISSSMIFTADFNPASRAVMRLSCSIIPRSPLMT